MPQFQLHIITWLHSRHHFVWCSEFSSFRRSAVKWNLSEYMHQGRPRQSAAEDGNFAQLQREFLHRRRSCCRNVLLQFFGCVWLVIVNYIHHSESLIRNNRMGSERDSMMTRTAPIRNFQKNNGKTLCRQGPHWAHPTLQHVDNDQQLQHLPKKLFQHYHFLTERTIPRNSGGVMESPLCYVSVQWLTHAFYMFT
jgi:hypothetical protein